MHLRPAGVSARAAVSLLLMLGAACTAAPTPETRAACQARLAAELKGLSPTEARRLYRPGAATQDDEGKALFRLVIPRLSANTVVVLGDGSEPSGCGASVPLEGSDYPGEGSGNTIVYLRSADAAEFDAFATMRPGDPISLETPLGRFAHTVLPRFNAHENPYVFTGRLDVRELLHRTNEKRLTLIMNPVSGERGIVVQALLDTRG